MKITISNRGAWAELTELKADATAADVGAYSKGESDQRFQPLGNYTLSSYSYSKTLNTSPKGVMRQLEVVIQKLKVIQNMLNWVVVKLGS